MNQKQILKLFLFLIYFCSVLKPAEALLGIDYLIGYLLSYIFEGIFEAYIGPALKYIIGGPPLLVRDALTAATPILGLSLLGDNGSWVAFSILSSMIQSVLTVVWFVISTSAELLATLITGNYNQIFEKIFQFFQWIPLAIASAGREGGSSIARSLSSIDLMGLNYMTNNTIHALDPPVSPEDVVNECLLLVLCSIYAEDNRSLLPQEVAMKDSFEEWRREKTNNPRWLQSAITATEQGRTARSLDLCSSVYNACCIPRWIARPAFTTLFLGQSTK